MNIGDVVLHTTKSLYVLVQGFAVPLGDHMQIACLARSYMATREGTNKLVAQIGPRGDGVYRRMH